MKVGLHCVPNPNDGWTSMDSMVGQHDNKSFRLRQQLRDGLIPNNVPIHSDSFQIERLPCEPFGYTWTVMVVACTGTHEEIRCCGHYFFQGINAAAFEGHWYKSVLCESLSRIMLSLTPSQCRYAESCLRHPKRGERVRVVHQ